MSVDTKELRGAHDVDCSDHCMTLRREASYDIDRLRGVETELRAEVERLTAQIEALGVACAAIVDAAAAREVRLTRERDEADGGE